MCTSSVSGAHLCTVYSVQCTLYTVHYTLYSVHCTLYTVQCTLYSVHCTLYTVHPHLSVTAHFHISWARKPNNLSSQPGVALKQLSGTPKWSKTWLSGTSKWSKILLPGTPKRSKIWLLGTLKWSKISILNKFQIRFLRLFFKPIFFIYIYISITYLRHIYGKVFKIDDTPPISDIICLVTFHFEWYSMLSNIPFLVAFHF